MQSSTNLGAVAPAVTRKVDGTIRDSGVIGTPDSKPVLFTENHATPSIVADLSRFICTAHTDMLFGATLAICTSLSFLGTKAMLNDATQYFPALWQAAKWA